MYKFKPAKKNDTFFLKCPYCVCYVYNPELMAH